MPRASTIRRLPDEVRELIAKLRDGGRTLDEIMAKLGELAVEVSRSALGRHVKQLDAIGEEIRRSRTIAEALVQRYGDAPESRTARLNIELMHAVLTKLIISEDGAAVQLNPQEAFFIATSLQKLSQASKQDADREAFIRKQLVQKIAEKVEAAEKAGEKGLSQDRIAELRREFLGVSQ